MKDFHNIPIVAPVDFSEVADWAVESAVELAGDPAHVTVVHVAVPIVIVEPVMVYKAADDEVRCEQLTATLTRRYADPKYKGLHFDVRVGDPGLAIVELASEAKAGLIVMPSHGRTGLSRLLLGSVAERVVRLAHCPVLILRR